MTGREGVINPDNFVKVRRMLADGRTLDIGSGNIHPHADVTLDIEPATDPDVVADLTEGIPFEDDAFANVAAVHVVEHLEDDVRLFEEMRRVASERAVAVVPIGHRPDPDHEHVYRDGQEVVERFDADDWVVSSMGPDCDVVFAAYVG